MDSGYENYAIDYSALFDDEVYTRPEGSDFMPDGPDHQDGEQSHAQWRVTAREEMSRFQKAGEAARRMREEGKGISEIMAAFKLTDPATIRRLDGALKWLAAAAVDPRSAALGGLDKRTFLAVVSRGILTVDELADRAGELSRLDAFGPNQMAEIKNVLIETCRESSPHQ